MLASLVIVIKEYTHITNQPDLKQRVQGMEAPTSHDKENTILVSK